MTIPQKYNYKGIAVTGKKQLRDQRYGLGYMDRYGEPAADWKQVKNEKDGFNLLFKIEDITLDSGTLLIRYGEEEYGHYTAPIYTPFEKLSMPWDPETIEYHVYEVMSPTKVSILKYWEVKKGIAAPGFDMPGGGIQYRHEKFIIELLKEAVLTEVRYQNERTE